MESATISEDVRFPFIVNSGPLLFLVQLTRSADRDLFALRFGTHPGPREGLSPP